MRIADKMNYDQVKSNLSRNRTEMADLQNQAATQKRVNKPSDDPLAAARVLANRTEINGGQQYLKNLNAAKSFLEYSEQSLGELSEALSRAKELAISQSNDASASQSTRQVVATEIRQLLEQAVQVGNRKLGDRFLFGGFRTTRPPFDVSGRYYGDDGQMDIVIDKEAKVAMNMPGSRIFHGKKLDSTQTVGPEPEPAGLSKAKTPAATPDEKSNFIRKEDSATLRGPASVDPDGDSADAANGNLSSSWKNEGVNIFEVLQRLEFALRANDKGGVHLSLDNLDEAMAQVVLARSELGSRVGTINSTTESLQKSQVESKTMVSSLEDADTFELVSDLNKSESTLKASLQTSGKLIQPSLLDFLR